MLPVVQAGLHCGDSTGQSGGTPRHVLPVVQAGLHCGTALAAGAVNAVPAVLPVVQAGLHCGTDEQVRQRLRATGAPRRSGGAPLRHRL